MDAGSNFGMEREYWCVEEESNEHVLEYEKVKEIIEDKDMKKSGWLVKEAKT